MSAASLHLAVALDGAGWHPAAWRDPAARPDDLFTAAYWAGLVNEAEHGLLDFVTIEDSLALQSHPSGRPRRPRRPGARALRRRPRRLPDRAADPAHRAGPDGHDAPTPSRSTWPPPWPPSTTSAAGGPDGARRSRGAAPRPPTSAAATFPGCGWRASTTPRPSASSRELFDEAADAVEVVRRLWDSWEDDAVIRDVRHRPLRRPRQAALHRLRRPALQRQGARRSCRGRRRGSRWSPRWPTRRVPYEFAARSADVVYVTPHDADAGRARSSPRSRGGRRPHGPPLKIFADLVVLPRRERRAAASARPGSTSSTAPSSPPTPRSSPARPDELADLLAGLAAEPGWTGSGCGPPCCRDDLDAITGGWCRSCSDAASSAPRTRRARCAGGSACPPARPAADDRSRRSRCSTLKEIR